MYVTLTISCPVMNPIFTSAWTGIPSSIVTAMLFGLYLASFAHCVRWLLFEDEGWRVRKKVNRSLVATTLVIFFLSTVSFSETAAGLERRPIPFSGTHVPAYFWAVTILDSVTAIHLSILIIIDGVLIHRCWIVFSKNRFIICFPLALWCSSLICAIISLYCDISFALYITDPAITKEFMVKTPYVVMDLLIFCVCNIVVNIYTTSALVYKIWRAAKNIAGTNHLLYRTCRILTESGILYTLPSVLYLACLIKSRIIESNDPLQAPTVDSIVLLDLVLSIERPLSTFMPGIAFNLITIRVGEQRARGQAARYLGGF
ncbi:hypothetical protein JOM56_011988 [Amanita muscaria]